MRRRRSTQTWQFKAYDFLCITLLALVPIVATVIFGGSRLWSFGPLMAIAFLATFLVALRPVWFSTLRDKTFYRPPGWFALCLFAGFACVMVPFAAVPFDGMIECLMLLSYMAAYWSWAQVAGSGKRWEFMIVLLILGGTLLSWYAIIQHVRGSTYVLTLPRLPLGNPKASGTFISPNHFADLLAILIVMSASMLFSKKFLIATRLVAGYGILVSLPALFLSESRAGWIGLAAGIFVFGVGISIRRGLKQTFLTGLLLAMFLATAAYGLWTFSPKFKARFEKAFAMTDVRLVMWQDSLDIIRDDPALGSGPGSYRWMYPLYKNAYKTPYLYPRFAHNEAIHIAVELGLVGLVLAALIVAILTLRLLLLACRTAQDDLAFASAGVLGALMASTAHAMFDYTWHIFSNVHVLAMLGGIVAAKAHATGQLTTWPARKAPWFVVSPLTATASALLIACTAVVTTSYYFAFFAGKSRHDLDYDKALILCDKSEATFGGYYHTYVERGKALYSQGMWNLDPAIKKAKGAEAIEAYDRALQLNPYDLLARHGKSQSLRLTGDSNAALLELAEILRLAPTHYYYVKEFGLMLRQKGHYEQALKVFTKARELGGPDEMVLLNLSFLKRKIREEKLADQAKTENIASPQPVKSLSK